MSVADLLSEVGVHRLETRDGLSDKLVHPGAAAHQHLHLSDRLHQVVEHVPVVLSGLADSFRLFQLRYHAAQEVQAVEHAE